MIFKNLDISNQYIERYRRTLPIYRIEKKNIDAFSKWTPLGLTSTCPFLSISSNDVQSSILYNRQTVFALKAHPLEA